MGEEAFEVYQQTPSAQQLEGKCVVLDTLKIFRKLCNFKMNIVFEQHQFWPHHLGTNGIDMYTAKLRQHKQQQESEITANDMLGDKTVFHVTDKRLGDRLLRETDLCFQKSDTHLLGLGSHTMLK